MSTARVEPKSSDIIAPLNSISSNLVDEDPLDSYRANCGWFQWLHTCLNFHFVVQQIPLSLHYDLETKRYHVRNSRTRTVMWATLHIIGLLAFCAEILEEVHVIRQSHDDLRYFDLLHSVGWISYDYPFILLLLTKAKVMQEFFDELQDSPLLKISSPKKRVLGLCHLGLLCWYFITTFMFYPTRWNILDWSLENYYIALQYAAELYFGVPRSWNGSCYFYQFVIFITFLITTFQYNTVQMDDILAVTCVGTMKQIAADLDRAIKSGKLDDVEVLQLISAQKRLIRKFNRAFGFLIAMYVVYATPYYALHLVDVFETPGLMNQLSMFTFIGLLALSCKWSVDMLIMAQRRKRWLIAHGQDLKMNRSALVVFLDDLVWEKYGVGSYYTVNAYSTGQVLTLILTVAIVRIQSQASHGD